MTEVDKVEGPYDIVVKLYDENTDRHVKGIIGKQMVRIQGISSTLTLMSEDD